jgi:hypothetical protein
MLDLDPHAHVTPEPTTPRTHEKSASSRRLMQLGRSSSVMMLLRGAQKFKTMPLARVQAAVAQVLALDVQFFATKAEFKRRGDPVPKAQERKLGPFVV